MTHENKERPKLYREPTVSLFSFAFVPWTKTEFGYSQNESNDEMYVIFMLLNDVVML